MSDRSALKPSFCRICYNACPILVDVRDGAAVRVIGDAQGWVHGGYTCVKGRAQPSFLRDPERILQPHRRRPDGGFERIDSGQAIEEIAARITGIVERHGPRAVALYTGTNVGMTVPGGPFASAFMNALGSPMKFTSITIDKPGRMIAEALHGTWGVPDQGMEDPEVIFFLGVNPVLTYTGLPAGNPRRWLDAAIAKGTCVVVVDPRRSDTARRAFVHLQARPGFDAAIIAAILRTIIEDRLHDAEFVAENVQGFEALAQALQPFTVEWVAQLAGVSPDDLRLAARTIGRARRGYSMAGTGPSMAGPNTLIDYLLLSLETICGRRLRAGQTVRNPGALLRRPTPRAQASPPRPGYGFGERMRVRGLTNTAAGMPTGALAEEMLIEGEGRR